MSTVLVYSDDAAVRERVKIAVGRRPDPALDAIDWLEAADGGALVARVDQGGVDICILDGEAAPEGGMGLSRQLKNEIVDCPSMVLLVARRDDHWLAKWSLADGMAQQPVDPVELTNLVVQLLRGRAARVPADPRHDDPAGH